MKKNFLVICCSLILFACQETKSPATKTVDGITTKTVELEDETTICVKRIIAFDNQLWELRNDATLERSLSEAITTYVRAFDQADFSSCPPEFERAFQHHLGAWKGIIAVTDKHPKMRGKMVDLFDQLENGEDAAAMKKAIAQIDATWAKVEAAMKK